MVEGGVIWDLHAWRVMKPNPDAGEGVARLFSHSPTPSPVTSHGEELLQFPPFRREN